MEHFQILSDCPNCHVEGAVTEIFDQGEACCHLGVALEARCRLCGLTRQGLVEGPRGAPEHVTHAMTEERCPGCMDPLDEEERHARRCTSCGLEARAEVTRPPIPLDSPRALHDALARWAAEENFGTPEDMLDASFGGLTLEALHAAITQGQRVETSFDVLGFLFAHMGGSGGGQSALQAQGPQEVVGESDGEGAPRKPDDAVWGFAPTARIQLPTALRPHRRNRVMAMISVMAADGQIRPSERAFVERVLSQEGLDPLRDDEIRVHRPHEIGPVGSLKEREALLEMMIDLAHIDDEKDETEMRVVRDFARAWGVDPARVDAWEKVHDERSSSRIERFFSRVKSLLLA